MRVLIFFFHVRCITHMINLIVQYDLKGIVKTIEKIQLSMKCVTCFPGIKAIFFEIAKQMNMKRDCFLVFTLDVILLISC